MDKVVDRLLERDGTLKQVVELKKTIDEKISRIAEANEIRKSLVDYNKLSYAEKLNLHERLALKANDKINNGLSRALTKDALKRIFSEHDAAIFALNFQLERLKEQHAILLSKSGTRTSTRGSQTSALDAALADLGPRKKDDQFFDRQVDQIVRDLDSAAAKRIAKSIKQDTAAERREINRRAAAERARIARIEAARRAEARRIAAQQAARVQAQADLDQQNTSFDQQHSNFADGFVAGFLGGLGTSYQQPSTYRMPYSPPVYGGASSSQGGMNCRAGESIQRCIHR